MTRNLHHRIETTFPVYDEKLKAEIIHFMKIQLKDNTKARLLSNQQSNAYFSEGSKKVRSQEVTYDYFRE